MDQMLMTKADKDKRLFSGWATVEVVDKQGELVDIGAFKKVMKAFMDMGGNIIDTHSNKTVAKVLDYEFMKKDGKDALRFDMECYKHYDYHDVVWEKIKSGEYSGLSMGGRRKAGEFELVCDDGGCHNFVKGIELFEVSVVDEPANPEATIDEVNTMAKSLDMIKCPDGQHEHSGVSGCHPTDRQHRGAGTAQPRAERAQLKPTFDRGIKNIKETQQSIIFSDAFPDSKVKEELGDAGYSLDELGELSENERRGALVIVRTAKEGKRFADSIGIDFNERAYRRRLGLNKSALTFSSICPQGHQEPCDDCHVVQKSVGDIMKPEAFDRCVEALESDPDIDSPHAVCQATVGKSQGGNSMVERQEDLIKCPEGQHEHENPSGCHPSGREHRGTVGGAHGSAGLGSKTPREARIHVENTYARGSSHTRTRILQAAGVETRGTDYSEKPLSKLPKTVRTKIERYAHSQARQIKSDNPSSEEENLETGGKQMSKDEEKEGTPPTEEIKEEKQEEGDPMEEIRERIGALEQVVASLAEKVNKEEEPEEKPEEEEEEEKGDAALTVEAVEELKTSLDDVKKQLSALKAPATKTDAERPEMKKIGPEPEGEPELDIMKLAGELSHKEILDRFD